MSRILEPRGFKAQYPTSGEMEIEGDVCQGFDQPC